MEQMFLECQTKIDFVFKYIVIFTSGINYHIQKLLQPFCRFCGISY
ncbi:hypothetical protein GCM10007111_38550 [Virgibacillus kapii]|uniref:Uncharacterized protein n=1 Tax=Virgibacillus kapii TaxID=1638645 RepID=A0ABQ2DUU6_9BACI|nr:hypothetical protein M948_05010 [Virgibacillus sp. CM-4]GGJ73230.1 hypothetical protein GCM10007111_38550 [Virgibacillus kapii]